MFQPGEPIELIGGQLMIAEPQGEYHYQSIWKTAHALEAAFGPGWFVRTQAPIGLDEESEPEPDVAVVPGSLTDYGPDHPARPVLTVEVSESSLAVDRGHKGSLYARAGLDDYWVVNLVDRVLEVYREPVRDPDGAVRLALRAPRGARPLHASHTPRGTELRRSALPTCCPSAYLVAGRSACPRMRPTLSGAKKAGAGMMPASVLRKSLLACGLVLIASSSRCMSGGGGSSRFANWQVSSNIGSAASSRAR